MHVFLHRRNGQHIGQTLLFLTHLLSLRAGAFCTRSSCRTLIITPHLGCSFSACMGTWGVIIRCWRALAAVAMPMQVVGNTYPPTAVKLSDCLTVHRENRACFLQAPRWRGCGGTWKRCHSPRHRTRVCAGALLLLLPSSETFRRASGLVLGASRRRLLALSLPPHPRPVSLQTDHFKLRK